MSQIQRWITQLKDQTSKRKSVNHSFESLKTYYDEIKLEFRKLEKNMEKASELTKVEEKEPAGTQNSSVNDIQGKDDMSDPYAVTEAVYL